MERHCRSAGKTDALGRGDTSLIATRLGDRRGQSAALSGCEKVPRLRDRPLVASPSRPPCWPLTIPLARYLSLRCVMCRSADIWRGARDGRVWVGPCANAAARSARLKSADGAASLGAYRVRRLSSRLALGGRQSAVTVIFLRTWSRTWSIMKTNQQHLLKHR